jgi:hypothetical protein
MQNIVETRYLRPPTRGISQLIYDLGFRKLGSSNLFAVFGKVSDRR